MITSAHQPRVALRILGPATLAIAVLVAAPLTVGTLPLVAALNATGDDEATILHVLNRITYGPRPGDVDRVRAIGVDAYIEQQLHPDRIDDDELLGELARFETLELDTATIVQRFFLPAQEARRQRQQQMARASERGDEPEALARPGDAMTRDEAEVLRRLRDVPEEIQREHRLYQELMDQRLVRAVASERQLQEVLVDFWFNHFNVSVEKSPMIRPFMTEYERDVIRPNVLGRFRDLLGAVAESPAMLIYLDNWLSSDPDAPGLRPSGSGGPRGVGRARRQPGFSSPRLGFRDPRRGGMELPTVQPGRRNGLNENYARELLELHTLGVDGGYTQDDVVEVARVLTGWTIGPLPRGGGFRFESRLHEEGEKVVLGLTIDTRGKAEGDAVLDLLSRHPSTARFVSAKLVSRFVADEPPASLVDRTAATFLQTDGDLRAVTLAILTSPEFFAVETRGAKVKTPLEFVVSSVRALDAEVDNGMYLVRALRELGMPLYACQPPTGYSDRADAWVNTGALLARMNFAVALVSNRARGVWVDLDEADRRTGAPVQQLFDSLVLGQVSDATRDTLEAATTPEQVAILALGSPEFQRQ